MSFSSMGWHGPVGVHGVRVGVAIGMHPIVGWLDNEGCVKTTASWHYGCCNLLLIWQIESRKAALLRHQKKKTLCVCVRVLTVFTKLARVVIAFYRILVIFLVSGDGRRRARDYMCVLLYPLPLKEKKNECILNFLVISIGLSIPTNSEVSLWT